MHSNNLKFSQSQKTKKYPMNLRSRRLWIGLVTMVLAACQAVPSTELNATPDLHRFVRFELTAQSSSGSAPQQQRLGTLEFKSGASSFEATSKGNTAVDRLYVQPDACRDDASPDCKRRFVISGRMAVDNTSVNCYVPVRNDSNLGYAVQSLTGICQDRHGRIFALTLFGR